MELTKTKTQASDLLKEYDLKSVFEKKEIFYINNDKTHTTGDYALVDISNERYVRSCTKSYLILQNETFIESILEAIQDKTNKIINIESFKENNGLIVSIDSEIEVPSELTRLIKSIDLIVVDGNTQETSLSGGIRINLRKEGFVFYMPNSCKSNRRNIRDYGERVNETKIVIEKTLRVAERVLSNLIKLDKVTMDMELFIKQYYNDSKVKTGKLNSSILDIEKHIFANSIIHDSLSSSIVGLLSFFYDKSTRSEDMLAYLLFPKGTLSVDNLIGTLLDDPKDK